MFNSDNTRCRQNESTSRNDYDYDYVDDSKIIMDLIANSQSNPNNLQVVLGEQPSSVKGIAL